MKTVLILRHAKSDWGNSSLADFDRPLNKRGRAAAPVMGALLRTEQLVPDLIITSAAKRARKTAKLAAAACGYEGDIMEAPDLYLAGAQAYIQQLRSAPETAHRVMVVGHNPDVEELIRLLTGRQERMPTAALAQIDCRIATWRALSSTCEAELVNLWRPRDLA